MERHRRKCDKISAARIILRILKFFGVWRDRVDETHINRKNIIKLCLVHLPASFGFCILVWIEVFTAADLDQAANVVYMSLALTVYIVKLLNILYYSKRAYNYIYDLEYDNSFDLCGGEEVEMWQKYQKIFIFVVILYLGSSLVAGAFGFVGVLFDNDYQLGYPYWVPFDWHKPQTYWYAYSFNVMGIVVSCLTNGSLDLLGCYMLFHISLLYKLLGFRIRRLKYVSEKYAIQQLRQIIKLHTKIKRMTAECEILISYYVLAQIILSALIICFCGYRLQKQLKEIIIIRRNIQRNRFIESWMRMHILANLGQFFGMLQFFTIMIVQIYLPCYFANEVRLNSTNLLTTMYDSEWLEFSVTTRKFICLYMEFLKHPVQIKAGNFFEIGLPIFTKVLNNAYSYFALLLNMDT